MTKDDWFAQYQRARLAERKAQPDYWLTIRVANANEASIARPYEPAVVVTAQPLMIAAGDALAATHTDPHCFERPYERDAAFYMLTNAQRDDGASLSFMTPREREVASEEWSARLRALVKAAEVKERNRVLVDIQCDDIF